VLGFISAILMAGSWLPIPDFVLAVLAIIFGALCISAANKRPGANRVMASSGITFGVLVVAVILLLR